MNKLNNLTVEQQMVERDREAAFAYEQSKKHLKEQQRGVLSSVQQQQVMEKQVAAE